MKHFHTHRRRKQRGNISVRTHWRHLVSTGVDLLKHKPVNHLFILIFTSSTKNINTTQISGVFHLPVTKPRLVSHVEKPDDWCSPRPLTSMTANHLYSTTEYKYGCVEGRRVWVQKVPHTNDRLYLKILIKYLIMCRLVYRREAGHHAERNLK